MTGTLTTSGILGPAPETAGSSQSLLSARRGLQWVALGLAVAWNLWDLRATVLPVSYLDDASMHEQMVRYATRAIQAGHNPLTGWFPFLGAGSPQFLHYQSLGAILTALAGLIVGPDAAFRWSMFLLLALWPLVIYAAGRILQMGVWASTTAAVLSSLLMTVPGVGYEHKAYVWIGFGVWAQLWASWTLPLAWAFTWRAVGNRKFLAPAALLVALTAALHFETGYLALLGVVVLPFVVPSDLKSRLQRAGVLLACSLLASAWVVIPLIAFGKWAAINQVLQSTPLVNGYGAGRILSWLVNGQVYDAGRFPVITLLALVGLAVSIRRWRTDPLGRALVVLWVVCLMLAFGRTTFGSLINVIPASHDIFFRRFLMGTQLAGLYLAGQGAAWCARAVIALTRWAPSRLIDGASRQQNTRWLLVGVAGALGVAAVVPAFVQVHRYDDANASAIEIQRDGESIQGPQITPLISYIKSHGQGRTYAGLPTNWGMTLTVGAVPVFKYLESQDVDEIGYTLRTASLMTDPEYLFQQSNPSDFILFGVRYLILPVAMPPPVPASSVMQRGSFRLWEITASGYLSTVETIGEVAANRADVATRTEAVLHSSLAAHHEDLSVAFAGSGAADPTAPSGSEAARLLGTMKTVTSQPFNITNNVAAGTVHLPRPAIVMFSASYDPGWHVTVDGRAEPTQMLAPAVVGVAVKAGVHHVVFTYEGFAYYPELAILGVLALALLLVGTRRSKASPKKMTSEMIRARPP